MAIPNNIRVPFFSVEFDSSRAFQGPALLEYQGLMMGQKITAGTKAELITYSITSADQAAEYFGNGSQLHRMAISWFAANKTVPLIVVPIDDAGAGVAATGTYAFSGTATAAGVISATIAGELITAAVASGDTATVVGDSLVTAIAAKTSLPVTSANVTGTVTLTAKNKGEAGNDVDLRINFNDGEILPAGITVVVTTLGGVISGATNPDVQEIIDILGDEWYNIWVSPWIDTTNLGKIETELVDRFGPLRMIDAVYFSAKSDTQGNLTTFGNGRNSAHVEVMGLEPNYPSEPIQFISSVAGRIAQEGQADPARPFQTLSLPGIIPPPVVERFTFAERNILLFDGIATNKVGAGGVVQIERAITMYQTNAAGANDIAFLDVNTLLTLMFLRFDFRTTILTKYPRAKLADDGVNIQSGQSIMTPKIMKAEAIAKFRQWEFLGLVENIDQFKNDLIVERSITDPNRLDIILPPDLVNQFRVGAAAIQFLLQSPVV